MKRFCMILTEKSITKFEFQKSMLNYERLTKPKTKRWIDAIIYFMMDDDDNDKHDQNFIKNQLDLG